MAVIPVEKVLIVIHKSIKDTFLHNLQKEGIVHITELKESTSRTSEAVAKINDALSQLSPYKKRGMLETFVKIKKPINFETFEKSAKAYDYPKTVTELEAIKKERERSTTLLHNLQDDITLLSPWTPLNYDISFLKAFKRTEAVPCIIPSKEIREAIFTKIDDIPHSYEVVNTVGSTFYYIFFVRKEDAAVMRSRLIENECEVVEFGDLTGIPAHLIAILRHKVDQITRRIEELHNEETALSEEMSQLELASDHIVNERTKEDIAENLPETTRTVSIIGWVKKRDMKRLDALVKKSELAVYDRIKPEPQEKPPVALQNPKWSSPYEMLVKLYSMPHPKEYDPTPFLAVFFPLFFALCITDAIYGIFLIFFCLYLLKRVAGDRSLIWILLVGGFITIFTGSMVGGWAGNLFDQIAYEPLIRFKNSLMLFDPLVNPMIFLGLALGIGFIHMLLGITIEVIDSMRNGAYGEAIFANLTWLIFLPLLILYFTVFKTMPVVKAIFEIIMWVCVVGIVVFAHQEAKAQRLDQIIWAVIIWLIWYPVTQGILGILFNYHYTIQVPSYVYYVFGVPLLIIEIIRFREAKKVLGKIAWGLYRLYGISTYLSVVLSYVRLMALGMVTGVIAMAINIIAWMVLKIPIIGIVFTILILIGGHLFNLVINCLGGFIHTMRLQYIEFFGRFYSGGSKPFKPFGFETKYVEIE